MLQSLRSIPRRRRTVSAATVAALASFALIAASATGAQGGATKKVTPVASTVKVGGITVNGVSDVAAQFKGVPQSGPWVGSPTAPIQMVVFADPQCPFCREFDTAVMPTLVKEYVRTGKMRVYFSGMAFIGGDSTRGLKAAAAAADQNKLWNFVTLMYVNQGDENKGWLSDKTVDAIAKTVPGLDFKKFDAARKSSAVDGRLTTWQGLSSSAGVTSTPTFLVGTNGKFSNLAVTALEVPQFRTALDKLLKAK